MPETDNEQPSGSTVRYYPHSTAKQERSFHTGYGGWGSPENKAITERITADQDWLAQHDVRLAQWGPDPVSGKVKIYLTQSTDIARRVLIDRYGDAIVVAPEPMSRPVGKGARPIPDG